MLRRILKEVDASDVLIAGALAGLGLAVAMKSDIWTGLAVACAAVLAFFTLAMLASR